MTRPQASVAWPDVSGWVLAALLLLLYGLFLGHRINLVTADLGRHIKTGELLSAGEWAPLSRNYYSYTEPDFPVVNHHWGSGAVFYALWRLGGFAGLQAFFIALSLTGFWFFYDLARRESSAALAAVCAALLLPLLAERTEIRPEAFSYFFCALFYWVLSRSRQAEIPVRWLLALPALQTIWVNTHIYWVFGPMLVGLFWLEALARPSLGAHHLTRLSLTLALTAAAALATPFGLKGALAPLTIFSNYGYRLAENQSVWFMEKMVSDPNLRNFKLAFAALILSFAAPLVRGRKSFDWVNLALAAIFSAMAWLAVRNFTLFALFALAIICANLGSAFGLWLDERRGTLNGLALAGLLLLVPLARSGSVQAGLPYWHELGWGVETANSAAADFFKAQGIAGPIFNDYDIGGYLIFHLFPGQPVFVDNRPEAYSAAFFEKTYVPMQENEDVWRRESRRWNFNAIFFHRLDATPWAQDFLIRRVADPDWAPVFVDAYCIIFVKRTPKNRAVIARFEIPKSLFTVRKTG